MGPPAASPGEAHPHMAPGPGASGRYRTGTLYSFIFLSLIYCAWWATASFRTLVMPCFLPFLEMCLYFALFSVSSFPISLKIR